MPHHKKKFKRFANSRKDSRGEQMMRAAPQPSAQPATNSRRDVKRGALQRAGAHGKVKDQDVTDAKSAATEDTKPKPNFDIEEFPAVQKKSEW